MSAIENLRQGLCFGIPPDPTYGAGSPKDNRSGRRRASGTWARVRPLYVSSPHRRASLRKRRCGRRREMPGT